MSNNYKNQSYFDMTAEELAKAAQLTPKEKAAVDALLAAVKALPRTICFEVTDNFQGDGNLCVRKRISRCACQQVASLRKASICF